MNRDPNLPTPRLPTGLRVAVVGAGLGGLATALRLRHAGAHVILLEKNSQTGGKAGEYRADGFRWDTGPSLLTMPHVIDELFADLGLNRPAHLQFERVRPVCRYFWPDGTLLDENEELYARPDVTAFLKYASGIYDLVGDAFLNHPPDGLWRTLSPANWGNLHHLPKVATLQSLAKAVDAHFEDPHLRQLFQRFATYNGSSPYRTPATFNIISHVESHFGAWYIRGGMARLAECLTQLAEKAGVELFRDHEVIRLSEEGLLCRNGRRVVADVYVVNGDVIRAHRDWIRLPGHRRESQRLQSKELSLSGLVLFLGVKKRHARLSHHNIFFSQDYAAEFHQLFEEKKFPEDPTIYVNITSRSSPDDAPEGCDNYFVLVNAPAEIHRINWATEAPRHAARVIAKLESCGLTGLGRQIRHQHIFTPADFARRDLCLNGALYGWASHGPLTSLLRPPLQSRLRPNLYFTGATTHPGGGIPLVLLSARMVARSIIKKYGTE